MSLIAHAVCAFSWPWASTHSIKRKRRNSACLLTRKPRLWLDEIETGINGFFSPLYSSWEWSEKLHTTPFIDWTSKRKILYLLLLQFSNVKRCNTWMVSYLVSFNLLSAWNHINAVFGICFFKKNNATCA